MRIAFIAPVGFYLTHQANGARLQPTFQAAALRRLGHQVDLLSPWEPGNPADYDVVQFFMGGYPFWGIEKRAFGKSALVFAPMIDSNVSFRAYRIAAFLGSLGSRLNTIPGTLRRQAIGSDLVICRSNHERDRVVYGLGVNPRRTPVHVVLNGTEATPQADPQLCRRRLDLPVDFILGVGGYWEPRKNAVRLAEAAAALGFPLVLVGPTNPSPALNRLQTMAARGSSLILLGYQPQEVLNSLYAACRVFALPSLHEGTGMVSLDAAAQGPPVVVTKNGGPPSYFKDLEMAYQVDPFSPKSIREGLQRAWQCKRTGRLAQHVRENLTWDKSARSLLSAYEHAKTPPRGTG